MRKRVADCTHRHAHAGKQKHKRVHKHSPGDGSSRAQLPPVVSQLLVTWVTQLRAQAETRMENKAWKWGDWDAGKIWKERGDRGSGRRIESFYLFHLCILNKSLHRANKPLESLIMSQLTSCFPLEDVSYFDFLHLSPPSWKKRVQLVFFFKPAKWHAHKDAHPSFCSLNLFADHRRCCQSPQWRLLCLLFWNHDAGLPLFTFHIISTLIHLR